MSLTVRVQPVVLSRDWRQTVDWIARVFELPVTLTSDSAKFGELLIAGERLGVLGRDVPAAGEATSALEIEVFDLAAALERATANKAAVIVEPVDVDGAGRHATIKLPTGVILSLWEPAEDVEPSAAMGNGPIHFSVGRRIHAPAEKVFEAITTASQLSRYFIKDAKGDLAPGAEVTWIWDNDAVALKVTRVIPSETVEFVWEAYGVDYLTRVRFDVIHKGKYTRLTVVESGWHNDARGWQSAFDHAEGWTEFLLHARMWVERGIDLR